MDDLRQQYLHLTNQVMPAVATQRGWPVHRNHCFQRIILDTLFHDCWYHHLDRTSRIPAYRQLSQEQLVQALAIAQQMLDSTTRVEQLNQQSLRYRGKQRSRP